MQIFYDSIIPARTRSLTVAITLQKLKREYPDAACTLDWRTPLELLVAAILSAQCTDARVNLVGRTLFKKYRNPEDYLAVPLRELQRDIHSCGAFRVKARAIRESCRTITEGFGGGVPETMEGMLRLRGVGRKTAAVVLGTAFGIVEGIPIDTHNTRLLRRMGLTKRTQPLRIELEMMEKTPRKDWLTLSHLMVAHGRKICTALNRKCDRCVLRDMCPSSRVRGLRDLARSG